jgi:hypothetical protein
MFPPSCMLCCCALSANMVLSCIVCGNGSIPGIRKLLQFHKLSVRIKGMDKSKSHVDMTTGCRIRAVQVRKLFFPALSIPQPCPVSVSAMDRHS